MPRPSEYLLQAGWKPWNENLHPNATLWIDPQGGPEVTFIEAVALQLQRDRAKEK